MRQHRPPDPVRDRACRAADPDVVGERQATATVLRAVWDALEADGAPPRLVLRPGAGRWTVEWAATVVLHEVADGDAALARVARALAGWDRRVRTTAVVRLTARALGRTVDATHHAGTVVVSVRSRSLPVGRARSLALRGRS